MIFLLPGIVGPEASPSPLSHQRLFDEEALIHKDFDALKKASIKQVLRIGCTLFTYNLAFTFFPSCFGESLSPL